MNIYHMEKWIESDLSQTPFAYGQHASDSITPAFIRMRLYGYKYLWIYANTDPFAIHPLPNKSLFQQVCGNTDYGLVYVENVCANKFGELNVWFGNW